MDIAKIDPNMAVPQNIGRDDIVYYDPTKPPKSNLEHSPLKSYP